MSPLAEIHTFSAPRINALYCQAVRALVSKGIEIERDGQPITEIYPAVFIIQDPRQGILHVPSRPYSPAFMVAETLWNLTGDTQSWLCFYNSKYKAYFTDGLLLAGYGNRIFNWGQKVNQLDKVVEILRQRPYSQHATLIIFDPAVDLDNPPFVPCITKIKFRIRQDRLHMTSYLRAQDIWLGFPYDVHLLLALFQLTAQLIGVPMGTYYHHCDVLRLYAQDYRAAAAVRDPGPLARTQMIDLALPMQQEMATLRRYRDLVRDLPRDLDRVAESEPTYWRDALLCCHAYRLLREGQTAAAFRSANRLGSVLRDQFQCWAGFYYSESIQSLMPGDS